jgi:hypothetical protein
MRSLSPRNSPGASVKAGQVVARLDTRKIARVCVPAWRALTWINAPASL